MSLSDRAPADPPSPAVSRPDAHAGRDGDEPAGDFTAKQRAVLAALPGALTVTAAAKAAGVARRSVHRWADRDPAFAAALADAREEAADHLEAEARRRAVEGTRSYKFLRDGTPIRHPLTGDPYWEPAYSDRLLEILLKAARPEKYRERSDVAVSPGDLSGLSDAELKEQLARMGVSAPPSDDLEGADP